MSRREYEDRDSRHDRDKSDRKKDDRGGRHDRDHDRDGRHDRDRDLHRRREGRDRLRDSDRDRDRHHDRERDRHERVRDRSRERSRERMKSRDRDADRDRDPRASGANGPSRSVPREDEGDAQKRSRSQDPGHAANGFADEEARNRIQKKTDEPELPPPPPAALAEVDFDADITADEMQMMTMMGIPFGFDSTQGKHVEDEASNAGAVKAKEKRRARQYMNRRGGFNRPLPAERTGETARRD